MLRFDEIKREIIRAGLSPRSAERMVSEIQDHYRDLVDAEVASGNQAMDAHLNAAARLGDEETIVRGIVCKNELRTLEHRHPLLMLFVAPLLFCMSAVAVCLGGFNHLAPDLMREYLGILRIVCVFTLPLFFGSALFYLAARNQHPSILGSIAAAFLALAAVTTNLQIYEPASGLTPKIAVGTNLVPASVAVFLPSRVSPHYQWPLGRILLQSVAMFGAMVLIGALADKMSKPFHL